MIIDDELYDALCRLERQGLIRDIITPWEQIKGSKKLLPNEKRTLNQIKSTTYKIQKKKSKLW